MQRRRASGVPPHCCARCAPAKLVAARLSCGVRRPDRVSPYCSAAFGGWPHRDAAEAALAYASVAKALRILAVRKEGIKKRLWAAAPCLISIKARVLPQEREIAADARWIVAELMS